MKILGYNHPRPTFENYTNFERTFNTGLLELGINGISHMEYGSFIREDSDIGRSDIDAVLIFPDDVVIDKENLQGASVVLHQALKDDYIPFQVTVTDISTLMEGRFNCLDTNFKQYFDMESMITGTDYRSQITYELPTMNDQTAVRFNLRKVRTGFLFSDFDINNDYTAFLYKFQKSLDAISRGSKQILSFVDDELRLNRFSAMDEIQRIFPEVNTEPLQKIKGLYQNLDELDEVFRQPEEALNLWNQSATFFEEMIREYIRKFPR